MKEKRKAFSEDARPKRRALDSAGKGYDEDRDDPTPFSAVGYIEPKPAEGPIDRRKSHLSKHQLVRRQVARAHAKAVRFFKGLEDLGMTLDDFSPAERERIRQEFAFIDPKTGEESYPTKRRRRTKQQVVEDLATEEEGRRLRYMGRKAPGKKRVKLSEEIAKELAKRRQNRKK